MTEVLVLGRIGDPPPPALLNMLAALAAEFPFLQPAPIGPAILGWSIQGTPPQINGLFLLSVDVSLGLISQRHGAGREFHVDPRVASETYDPRSTARWRAVASSTNLDLYMQRELYVGEGTDPAPVAAALRTFLAEYESSSDSDMDMT